MLLKQSSIAIVKLSLDLEQSDVPTSTSVAHKDNYKHGRALNPRRRLGSTWWKPFRPCSHWAILWLSTFSICGARNRSSGYIITAVLSHLLLRLASSQRRLIDDLEDWIEFMHSFKCCDNFFLFCHIIIFCRILSVSGLTFHHEVIEKKQKMKFTFTQVRLIKMSKKQFVGFRAGRPGFLLGGV